MPDHDDFDERIARLQRAAYGADVPDEQREAAATELAALRSPREQRVGRRGGAAGRSTGTADAAAERSATAVAADASPDEAQDDGATTLGETTPDRTWAQTSLVTATAIALLAGIAGLAAGWTLGAVASRGDQAPTVPASETEAWRVFDLPTPNGDRVRYPAPPVDLDLDRDSRRVLAARGDGVRVIAVRSVDGRDACLVLIVPVDAPAAACTVDGRFPAEGLVAQTEDPSAGFFYSATWDATGRISLAPAVPGD